MRFLPSAEVLKPGSAVAHHTFLLFLFELDKVGYEI